MVYFRTPDEDFTYQLKGDPLVPVFRTTRAPAEEAHELSPRESCLSLAPSASNFDNTVVSWTIWSRARVPQSVRTGRVQHLLRLDAVSAAVESGRTHQRVWRRAFHVSS